jgi:hypothetical protein
MTSLRKRFLAALLLSALLVPQARAQHWVETNTWRFDNFKTPELPWERYPDTFIGVPPDRDPWSSAFDVVFYDNLYKTELTKEGNCFGIALLCLLLLQNEGHQGICAPARQYTESHIAAADAPLRLLINQVHGHQVNLPALRLFLDIIAKSKNRDGDYAYGQVGYYWAQDDPAIVSITKSLSPADGGHSLVAYKAAVLGGKKRIFVYDPNRPWHTDAAWYQTNTNVITIGSGGAWDFTMADGELWSGSPSSGGNIVISPLSVVGEPSRLPSTLGLNALVVISMIFVTGGEGSLKQVTDGQGRRFFKPGTIEVETDPAAGMLNLVPWYRSDGQPARKLGAPYFFLRDPGQSLDVEVENGDRGYEVRFLGPRGIVRVRGAGGSGADALRLESTFDGPPSLVVRNTSGTGEYEVELLDVVRPREQIRSFRLSKLRVPSGAPVRLDVLPGDRGLSVSSPEAALSYDLRLRVDSALGSEVVERADLRIAPGKAQLVRPRGWRDLRKQDIEVQDRALPPRKTVR